MPVPQATRFRAAILHADVSGFTALTERLQGEGRDGVEKIAEIISGVFRPAISATERWRGSITAFGGDGLLTLFLGQSPVRRAVAVAQEIQASVARQPPHDGVKIEIAQVLHCGTVRSLHLGGEERHHLLQGAALRALARMEEGALRGRLLLSAAARRAIPREAVPTPWPGRPHPRTSPHLGRYVPSPLQTVLGRSEGEIRHVSILFLESRGGRLDSLQKLSLRVSDVLRTHGGVLLKSLPTRNGTMWIATFGLPSAHEDDEDRAARSALDLVERPPEGIAVRGAVGAGTVVNLEFGTRWRRSFDILGDVVNTTARATAEASWGEIVATAATCARLHGVRTEHRGRHAVKGKAEPVDLFALRPAARSRRAPVTGCPFHGRERELLELKAGIRAAADGRGECFTIRGESGIGKSRLAREAAREAVSAGFRVLAAEARPYGAAPMEATRDLLLQALPDPEGTADGVRGAVTRLADALHLTPRDRRHLEDIATGERGHLSGALSPEAARLNDLIALRSLFLAIARETPLCLLLDDVHTADEQTRAAVTWLAAAAPTARLLLLFTCRPPFAGPGRSLDLGELDDRAVAGMVGALVGSAPPQVIELVRARAGGNPLFVESIVGHLLDRGILVRHGATCVLARELDPRDVPERLAATLEARLGTLSPRARRVAQIAAVVGPRLDVALLAGLAGPVTRVLRELRQKSIVVEDGAELRFRSSLIASAAYQTLLPSKRRRLHAAVARKLAPSARSSGELGVVGEHWMGAGSPAPALPCFLDAARRAVGEHALEAAERHYRRFLELAPRDATDAMAARSELAWDVLRRVGRIRNARDEIERVVAIAHGAGRWRDEGEALSRAASLARRLGDHARTEERCGELLRLGDRLDDDGLRHRGWLELAQLRLEQGRLRPSLRLLDRCREAVSGDRALASMAAVTETTVLMRLGRLDDALRRTRRRLLRARRSQDPDAVAEATSQLAVLSKQCGHWRGAAALYRQSIARAREIGDRVSEGIALGNLATTELDMGRTGSARSHLEQALVIARETGERRRTALWLGNLGIACKEQGDLERARRAYEEALETARAVGDRVREGIVAGLLSDLLRQMGRHDDCRRMGHRALAVARATGNRKYEGVVLGNLALLHIDQRRLVRAMHLSRRALAIAREVRDRGGQGALLTQIAAVHRLRGQLGAASRTARRAMRILARGGERAELGKLHCERGQIALAAGRTRDARRHLLQARRIARAIGARGTSELGQRIVKLADALREPENDGSGDRLVLDSGSSSRARARCRYRSRRGVLGNGNDNGLGLG